MIAVEVVGAVILAMLLIGVTWMAVVGLLGVIGAVRLRRCRSCGHLVTVQHADRASVCPYCRHPWIASHVGHVRLRHLLPGEMQPAPPLSDQAGLPEAPAH